MKRCDPQTTRRRPDARYILPRWTRVIHFIKFLKFGYRTSMFGSPFTPSACGRPYCTNAGPNNPPFPTIVGASGGVHTVQSTVYDRSNKSSIPKPHACHTNPGHDTTTYLWFVWIGRQLAKPVGRPSRPTTLGRLQRPLVTSFNYPWVQLPKARSWWRESCRGGCTEVRITLPDRH